MLVRIFIFIEMKVCTYFLLFSIFAYAYSIQSNTGDETQSNDDAEDSSEYSDKEETDKNEEASVKTINTDIKSNLISIFRAPGITIAGFIEEIINILKTFDDDTFVEFLNVLDSEIRKYHYRGCKFAEVTNNFDTREFLATTLNTIKDQSASETRENLKAVAETIKNEAFDNNLKELLTYIDSLYANAGEKLLKVINDLEEMTNSQSKSTEQDLGTIIKNGVRSVLFDHYSNLNISIRRELKNRIEKFWRNYKESPSRRMPNVISETHAVHNVKNSNRHKIKKLEPVQMERIENKNNIKDKNKESKRRFEPADTEFKSDKDEDAKASRKTKKHQDLLNLKFGKDHKTRLEVEPRLGYDTGLKHQPKNVSRERSQPREPLKSILERDRIRRYIQRHNMEAQPIKYSVEFKEDLKENPQSDLDYEEMKEQKASHSNKTDNYPPFRANTEKSKPQLHQQRDTDKKLMKNSPMLSFYLTTNPNHVVRLTRPTIKPHYKFQNFNNESGEHSNEMEADKFKKENMQRAYSSVEKDPHVIKRIKNLESQLYQVRNKVNKVNNEVVRIKKVLFKKEVKENSASFSNALRGRDKSKMAKGDIEREILENNEEINHYYNNKTTNQDFEIESIWTNKVFNVTPNFKAKENLKKTTTERQDEVVTEKDRPKPVRTSTVNVSDIIEVTDVKTETFNTTVAVITTKEFLTTPATTVVTQTSAASVSSTEPNSSLDVSDVKPSNNYIIKVY